MYRDLSALNVLKDIRDGECQELASLLREYCTGEGSTPIDEEKVDFLFAILARLESLNLIRRSEGHETVLNRSLARTLAVFSLSDAFPKPSILIRWEATEELWELQGILKISLSNIQKRQNSPHPELRRELNALSEKLHKELPASVFREDLLASVKELAICLREQCYIAALSLCGKILEIDLKAMMDSQGLEFQDDWMLGTLLRKLSNEGTPYLDKSLKNIANIINQHRIPAVHAKRNIPIPSSHQASMVVNATIDVTNRVFLSSALKKTNPGFKIPVSRPFSD